MSLTAKILNKQNQVTSLLYDLYTYEQLRELDIKKEDIVGQRKVKNGSGLISTEICQVKLKDGTEHFVPYELIYY